MDMAEFAQSGAWGLSPAGWGIVVVLLFGVVGAIIAIARLTARVNAIAAENYDLRHSMHDMREYVDVVSERLEHNSQIQREHLGQIADFLEFQQPVDFAALRRADVALPDSFLPDVDLHEAEDYAGEPLVHSDPSRVTAVPLPEPDLLSGMQSMGEIGDVADRSGAEADRVANESFAPSGARANQR